MAYILISTKPIRLYVLVGTAAKHLPAQPYCLEDDKADEYSDSNSI
jgi:hypothetical protein